MTDLLLPDYTSSRHKLEISLPKPLILAMDTARQDYHMMCSRSYFVEQAIKWFLHLLGEEDAQTQAQAQERLSPVGKTQAKRGTKTLPQEEG